MYPNLYQYPSQAFNAPNNALIRVTGIEGARAYQIPPNGTVALFDSGNDVMFIKSTDGAGFPTIRTFTFSEVKDDVPANNNYVSKDEFEQFKKEIMDYGKFSVPKSKQSTKQTTDAE